MSAEAAERAAETNFVAEFGGVQALHAEHIADAVGLHRGQLAPSLDQRDRHPAADQL